MTTTPTTSAPQKIWYKNQRVLRTGLTAAVAAVPVLIVILTEAIKVWPSEALVAVLLGCISVQGVLAKIMANEKVNAWLIAFTPFGSEPKKSSAE